jgi:hypothetical protein
MVDAVADFMVVVVDMISLEHVPVPVIALAYGPHSCLWLWLLLWQLECQWSDVANIHSHHPMGWYSPWTDMMVVMMEEELLVLPQVITENRHRRPCHSMATTSKKYCLIDVVIYITTI